MSNFFHQGIEYVGVRGSDVDRDGMYFEVTKKLDVRSDVLEIFYSDQTDRMTVTAFVPDVPLELNEWAIAEAKSGLPPA